MSIWQNIHIIFDEFMIFYDLTLSGYYDIQNISLHSKESKE